MKNYFLTLLERCSDESFGQDAVEWALVCGHIHLTYHLDTDLRTIMGEPGKPETGQYDAICEGFRNHCQQSYQQELEQEQADLQLQLV